MIEKFHNVIIGSNVAGSINYFYRKKYNELNKKNMGTIVIAKDEGNWINDLYEGYGSYKWADGRKFTGNFKNGNKNGQGQFS